MINNQRQHFILTRHFNSNKKPNVIEGKGLRKEKITKYKKSKHDRNVINKLKMIHAINKCKMLLVLIKI